MKYSCTKTESGCDCAYKAIWHREKHVVLFNVAAVLHEMALAHDVKANCEQLGEMR